jgi:dolichyl-phosphate beta-glucosyltransferase
MRHEAAVVIPCYNEADRLDVAAFTRFAAGHPDFSFIMVDDGSTDTTGDLLARLAEDPNGRFLHLPLAQNRGKAEAVRAGIVQALNRGFRFVGFWDADLATPLDELPRMLERFEARPELGIVLGSRVRMLGRTIERKPARHYLGRAFATVASLALRLPVYDTQCGAKLLRVEPALEVVFSEPFQSRWIFDVELLYRLRRAWGPSADRRMEEFPLTVWRDIAGSRLKARHMVGAAIDLMRMALRFRISAGRRALEPPSSGDTYRE